MPLEEVCSETSLVGISRQCHSAGGALGETRLQVKCLTQSRHLDSIALQMVGQLLHHGFFTVDKEGCLAPANAAAPCEQLPLVGVSGKSIDCVYSTADWNLFTKELYVLGSIDDLSRNRARGGKSDEDHRRFLPPQIVPQMVADPASCTHARTGHDDRAASYSVEGNRIGRLACEMQVR